MQPAVFRAYNVSSLRGRIDILREHVWRKEGGARDPEMRALGLAATGGCPARDDMCELKAIFETVVRNVRYTGDITGKDTFSSALRTLQWGGGDCLPLSTLVLRKEDYAFVSIGALAPGQHIMADGAWTQVLEHWITGDKSILAFDLNNGSTLRCSPEHRLFRDDGAEVRARDVRAGDVLRAPTEKLPAWSSEGPGYADIAPADFAWLVGVYIADGWHEARRFGIAGRDGKPKEAQKKRVQEIVEAAGFATRWHERYLAINDEPLTSFMGMCGAHAAEKRVPLHMMNANQIPALLEGLQADAGRAKSGTIVHGTTSPTLALQLRLLYRILGQSTHIRRVDNHGGLGSQPIYRVTVRAAEGEYKATRSAVRRGAKVKAIRSERPELCADITTDSGMFWLPESDVIAHNCDDHAVVNAVLAIENGFPVKFRITSNRGDTWDHIYTMAGVPKTSAKPSRWVALDTTLGVARFGHEPGRAKFVDFLVQGNE